MRNDSIKLKYQYSNYANNFAIIGMQRKIATTLEF